MTTAAKTKFKPTIGAGIPIRGLARLIDLGFIFLLNTVSAVFGLGRGITFALGALPFARYYDTFLIAFLSGLITFLIYETILEGWYGATVGKYVTGLVVVKENGTPCDVRSAFYRAFGMTVDGLFLGLIGVMIMRQSPLRQRRGDKWAHTLVIKRNELPQGYLKPRYPFGVSLVSASILFVLVDSFFTALGMILN